MPLVTSTEMFKKAYEGHYAVGAFNVNNMEIIQGIVAAAQQEKSPLILQVSAGARKYANHIYLMKLVEAAIEDTGLPICLHLDHGEDFDICKACVDGGFTSVMIDGSKHPFEENIEMTRRVVEYAHERGVVVEAELGRLAGVEDAVKVNTKDATYTDPDQAVEFVERTGCDSLAIAIGTSHGAYKFKGKPELDFARLEKITNLLPGYPLVLHGASTVIPSFVEECNKYGGMLDGDGDRVVLFPDDGHPDQCAEVLNLTGDPRDEIILWDAHKMYIYTQDRPAPDGPVYHPEKYPEYSASNYRGEFSFAHWDKAGD